MCNPIVLSLSADERDNIVNNNIVIVINFLF